jgi:large subunit ribosomal protein L24
MKVKKGDTVLVIAGKDKGAKGKVIQAYPDSDRILVEGVNRIKKHTKVSTTQRGAKTGGIVTQEATIHVSNVMVVDGDNKPAGGSGCPGGQVRTCDDHHRDQARHWKHRRGRREDPAPTPSPLRQ